MSGGPGRLSRRGFLTVAGGVAGGIAAGAAEPAAAHPGAGPAVDQNPAAAGGAGPGGVILHNRMRTDRQWARFLAGQDLIWKRMPRTWYEGPFLGDGFLGVMVYQEPGANALRFSVQHGEVQDHRPAFGNEWGVARLPVGHLTLEPVGRITAVDLRLDLWNAELCGTVSTDRGWLTVRALVQNDRSLLLAEVEPSAGERGFRWVFHPAKAISPRIVREQPPANFPPNPPWTERTDGDLNLVVQPLVAGGQTVTAYRETRSGHARRLYLSVAHSFPDTGAEARAATTVRRAGAVPASMLLRTHRQWWHDFYRKSFLSIPDRLLESFYWIQLYKVAAGSRAGSPVMATTGPWLEPTPWPGVWWNLNVQLEYWLVYGSNHLELDAIPRTLSENRQILVDALRPEYRADSAGLRRSTDGNCADAGFVAVPGRQPPDPEVGDLPWALHNVWLHYRHTMDTELLRDVLFPLLRRAMNYYLHFLAPGPDGRLHLPPTFSPEYGSAPDCNYDLALIRWSCATLLEASWLLCLDDPLAPRWREVVDRLVEYPVDANGYMIGAGVPFAKSHRHYSHLLMVYPLYLETGERPDTRALIERSLAHWISFEGALRGYSFTGAASISALLGRGDDALRYLRELVARFIQPNTMYYEAGPVIETPLSGAQSLHDMLVQSWGGVIRIFPAVPAEWRDAVVHDFRTEGAFLVSAVRRGGVTRFVRVRSLAGQPCRIQHGLPIRPGGRLAVRRVHGSGSGRGPVWRDLGGGVIEIDLAWEEEVVVYPAGSRPDFTIAPVRPVGDEHRWGLPSLPPAGAVIPVDLSGQYTNDGVAAEFAMHDGDFDGAGRTYPAEELPQLGRVVDDDIPFEFPAVTDGTKNNVTAGGQTIPLPPGRYARLHVLGAGDDGDVTATLVATYADGTTAPVTLSLTSWRGSPAFGETEAVRATHRHSRNGPDDVRVAIFHQKVALDPARELRSLTLPSLTGTQLHLFSVSLERPSAR